MLQRLSYSLSFNEPRVWHALTVRPGREQDAADWLKPQVSAYWPCYTRQTKSGRRAPNGRATTIARIAAVMPGYLFIASRPGTTPWPIVYQAPGIFGYLRDAAGDAACLSNDDIEVIRQIEAGMNLPPPPKHVHQFKIGMKVRFVDVPWRPGIVIRLADRGEIGVETQLLGQAVTVIVRPHQIERA